MSLQTVTNPGAEVVGNAFVRQYYHILLQSPKLAHRFYQDSSVFSRPDVNGVMTSVSTMQGINEKILSFNFKDYFAEVKTADAQECYSGGVVVLVTGCLKGRDNLKRKFAQSFFLASQENGYFVLNDIFRYVDNSEPLENHPVNAVDNTPNVPIINYTGLAKSFVEVSEEGNHLDSKKHLINEKEVSVESQPHSDGNDLSIVVKSASSTAQEDAQKKSYASIVKAATGSSGDKREHESIKGRNDAPGGVPSGTSDKIGTIQRDAPDSSNTQQEVEGKCSPSSQRIQIQEESDEWLIVSSTR